MVDASAIELPGQAAGAHDILPLGTKLDCRLVPFDGAAAAAYSRFVGTTRAGPHQTATFLLAWQEATGAEILLATVSADASTLTMVPLEVVSTAICRMACFPGGTHANGNMAPALPATAANGAAILAALRTALRRDRPDIDLLALERMVTGLDGIANPLAAVAADASPDIALSVRLDKGFDALLQQAGEKRKLKKHRAQSRKFEAAGGWRIVAPSTGEEVDRLVDAFLAMKAVRFARMGIPNVFAEPGCDMFLRRLYRDSLLEPQPTFELRGLEVGGRLRAVAGCSVSGKRLICDVSAMSMDELTHSSPGEFLFFDMIRDACGRGFAVFDFSVGDEPYKRMWCDTETRQLDHFLPLTGRGAAVATVSRSIAAMKRAIKSNPALWSLAKRLRRSVGGRDTTAGGEEG